MCGTPAYIAPEVILQGAKGGYETVVDSWSVGVIVFSMLTCMGPFLENSELDVVTRVNTRVVQWNLLLDRHITLAAHSFLVELLQPNPEMRSTIDGAMQNSWLKSYWPIWTFDGRQPVRNEPPPPDWEECSTQLATVEDIQITQQTQRMQMNGYNEEEMMSVDGEPSMSQFSETSSFGGAEDDNDEPDRGHDVPIGGMEAMARYQAQQQAQSQSQSQGGRATLQRRAHLMDEAAEGNGQLPQPSPDMIRHARMQEKGKRRRDEDSAMAEDPQGSGVNGDDAMMVSPKKKRPSNSRA